jgi:glycosyltransferase involved in cell wall biosynthesis
MKSIYKVLLITDNLSPNGGGAEKYFFTLKNELEKHSEVAVYTLGFGFEDKITENSVIIKETTVQSLRYFWRLFFNPLKYLQIRRALKKINPDIIHLHNVKKYTISLLMAVRPYKVVQTVHDYTSICPTGWNLHKNLQPCATGLTAACVWQHQRDINRLVYLAMLFGFVRMRSLLKKSVKKFIAPSPLLVEYLKKNNFNDSQYLPPFRPPATATSFESMRQHHFLYVGQLGKHKGVDALIEEFALACQTNPNLCLNIAGSRDRENFLREKVAALGVTKNINFLGWVNPEELYQETMAVIFPSIGLESFGLVLTEAMQHGRPVIGSNRGPTAWLIEHEKTGLLYDPLKKGDLATKILTLAENNSLIERYGRNAFEKYNTLMGNEEIIKNHLAIYEKLATRTT